jgi:hypothetical protein
MIGGMKRLGGAFHGVSCCMVGVGVYQKAWDK